jgi:hypothetical protein
VSDGKTQETKDLLAYEQTIAMQNRLKDKNVKRKKEGSSKDSALRCAATSHAVAGGRLFHLLIWLNGHAPHSLHRR